MSYVDTTQSSQGGGTAMTIKFVRGWEKMDARTREEKIQLIAWNSMGTNCTLLRQGRTINKNRLAGFVKCFPKLDYDVFISRYYPPLKGT